MNKLEHKSNILENGGNETSLINNRNMILSFLSKIKSWFNFKNYNEK